MAGLLGDVTIQRHLMMRNEIPRKQSGKVITPLASLKERIGYSPLFSGSLAGLLIALCHPLKQ